MLSIYVIGKSISKVKNCRYGTQSRKVFELHWKYYIDERRQALNCKEKQKYLIRIYRRRTWPVQERASSFRMVIKKTFLMKRNLLLLFLVLFSFRKLKLIWGKMQEYENYLGFDSDLLSYKLCFIFVKQKMDKWIAHIETASKPRWIWNWNFWLLRFFLLSP